MTCRTPVISATGVFSANYDGWLSRMEERVLFVGNDLALDHQNVELQDAPGAGLALTVFPADSVSRFCGWELVGEGDRERVQRSSPPLLR